MLSQKLRVLDIDTVFRFTPRRSSFSSKNRRTYILGIHLSGKSLHVFPDRQEVLEEGMVYFFHKDEPYSVEILEFGESFSVHFTAAEPVSCKSFFAPVRNKDGVLHQLEHLEKVFRSRGCCADSLSELYRLISMICGLLRDPVTEKEQRLERAQEYMNLHFTEKDCIAGAAAVCGVTPRRFNDLFQNRFRCTPNQYLLQRKLETARQLLPEAELSLSQVAELSGFSDVYYFSKVFKQYTGITPGAARR